MASLVLELLLLLVAVLGSYCRAGAPGSPIIIIPGIIGNQLEAKLNKTSVPKSWCNLNSDWYTLWVSAELLVPTRDYCFVDTAKLLYDPSTGTYTNNSGVEIRVPGFGNTSSVEYLDSTAIHLVPYFRNFVKYFVQQGYERGKSIRAAPYDWRLSPAELKKGGYYKALFELIEDTYIINNNASVTIVAHSMGGPVSLYFLSKYAPWEWKESRIKQYVPLSGVFAGSVEPLKGIISGDNEGVFTASPLVLREAQSSYPSQFLLTAFPSTLWGESDVLVKTPERDYSVNDYQELFNDIKFTNGWSMWKGVQNLVSDFPAPNVTTFCYYGINSSTPKTLVYKKDSFPDKQPSFEYGNGDGTVNVQSLEACKMWYTKQKQKLIIKEFDGIIHSAMVTDMTVIKAVAELVMS